MRRERARSDTAFFYGFAQASFGIRSRVMRGGRPGDIVTRFMAAAVKVDRRAIGTLGNSLRDGGPLDIGLRDDGYLNRRASVIRLPPAVHDEKKQA